MSHAVSDVQRDGVQPETARADAGRRRGRERAENRGPRLPEQIPYRQPYMRLNHTEVVSADELESIHEASLTILERIGMEFIDPESRSIMREAGADVDEATHRVRFPANWWRRSVAKAPVGVHAAQLEPGAQHARRRPLDGVRHGGSAPHYIDRNGVRKAGDREGFRDLLQAGADARHHPLHRRLPGRAGRPPPLASATSRRRYDILTMTDKGLHCYSLGRQRNRDCWRWCASPAASTRPRSTASRRSSRSSTPTRRCASTSRWRRA